MMQVHKGWGEPRVLSPEPQALSPVLPFPETLIALNPYPPEP